MKIGLIDVDGHNFPNIPLMKISAWHKAQGHHVEWYDPMFSDFMDRVYVSKVFSFTPDFEYPIWANEIIYGGSGYCILLRTAKRCLTAKETVNCHRKLNTFIRIIRFISMIMIWNMTKKRANVWG